MGDLPAESSPTSGNGVARQPAWTFALLFLAVAAAIGLLQLMQAILIPFVLAGLLFYILSPTVERLQRIHVPRWLAAGIMLIAFTGGIALTAYSLQDEAMTVVNQLPQGARRLTDMLERRPADEPGPLDKVQEAADELSSTAGTTRPKSGVMRVQVEEPRFQATTFLWASSIGVLSALNQFIMVIFLTFFMIVSAPRLKLKLVQVAGPTFARRKITVQILDEMGARIEQFLLVQLATSTIVALATWATLTWLGLEQAALWGLLAGILNSIPYYGPLIVTGGLSVVAFLQFGTISETLMIAGAALAITTIEGMLLTPVLLGRVARMNHVAVFVGLLFWSWVWGVWGILLAVPMMMVLKTVCERVEDLQPVATMLGD